MQYVGAKRYHRTAHEAWHPKSPQHLRRSLPPTSRPASRVYIHVHTCTSTTIHMHSREMHICMHASSCSICRIAPRGRPAGKAHMSLVQVQDKRVQRYTVTATVCVCVYAMYVCTYAQGALLCPASKACIVHTQTSRWQMQHAALCTPRSTPAQRAQPFRDGQMTL